MEFKYKILQASKRLAPPFLRDFARNHFSFSKFDLVRNLEGNDNVSRTQEDFPQSPYVLGIIKEPAYAHLHYVAACRDLRLSYRVIDILKDDWVKAVQDSGCDAFLVWPASNGTMTKAAFDARLKFMEDDMGKVLFPTWKECWLTEYKPRLRDWLQIHGLPHPKTWVFYDEEEAMHFVDQFQFDEAHQKLVVKTATGAAGCGVRIVSDKSALRKLAKRFFRRGVKIRAFEPWDLTRGYLFVQEFIPGVEEWRMVRIGDSYFGHRKDVGANGLHSGSHTCSYPTPTKAMLDLLKRVTDEGDFRSMDVDLFVAPDGRMWVNECQTTFGCSIATTQMKIDGIEGRYLRNAGEWRFESGAYCANHCCSLRVECLVQKLDVRG